MKISDSIFELQTLLQTYGFSEFSEEKGNLKKHTFLCNVYFPNTMSHLYLYEEYKHPENYILECGLQPKRFKPIRVPKSEFAEFAQHIMQPGIQLQPLQLDVWASWTRQRTKNLVGIDKENTVHGIMYLGYNNADFYGELNTHFVCNPYLASVCVNEAGLEDSPWGAAQFRTAYSGSFLNYEGVTYGDTDQMLFYISYNYVPTKFNINYVADMKFKTPLQHFPDDMPIDLILAIEAFNFHSLMEIEDMLVHIENNGVDSVFYTYVLLMARGIGYFMEKLPRIVANKNPDIIAYLQSYFSSIHMPEYTQEFERICNNTTT